jgi:hypothetical protein
MENEGGTKEGVAGAPEMKGEVAFGAAEMKPSGGEKLEMPAVQVGEQVSAVLPPVLMTASTDASTGSSDDEAPEVGKDAERMPKEYAKHLVEIMRKYKKEPNKLQRSVTSLKWDYMNKAFGRKLGDGLDGRAKD